MRLRAWVERPVADRHRRRAFALAASALLLVAGALSLTAEPPDDQPTPARAAAGRPPAVRPDDARPRQAGQLPAEAREVARRFIDGYLAHLYRGRLVDEIRGASDGLRRRLIARPVRVSAAIRRQRPRVERIDGQRMPGGWLVEAEIATAAVSFPLAVVVADRPGGPVVRRLVED